MRHGDVPNNEFRGRKKKQQRRGRRDEKFDNKKPKAPAPRFEHTVSRTPFELAVLKAGQFVTAHRPTIDFSLSGKRKAPRNSGRTYAHAEIANDTAEVRRLKAVFNDALERKSHEERNSLEKKQEASRVLEAVLTESAQRLFGPHAEVVLPTEYDDFKNATDAVIVFKNSDGTIASAIAVDFATQQDLDGYLENGVQTKGLEKKWRRSLQGIADERQNLHRLKYLTIGTGAQKYTEERGEIPRVILGLSDAEIQRVGALWGRGAGSVHTDPALQGLAKSVYRQLVAQLYIAKSEGRKVAEQSIKKTLADALNVSNADGLKKVLHKDPGVPLYQDSVLHQIDAVTKVTNLRRLYGESVKDAGEIKKRFDAGEFKPQWTDEQRNEPMSPDEMKKFYDNCDARKVDVVIQNYTRDFLHGKKTNMYFWYLPMVAAAVPTRIWMRLEAGALKSKDVGSPEYNEARQVFNDAIQSTLVLYAPAAKHQLAIDAYHRHYAPQYNQIARADTFSNLIRAFPNNGRTEINHLIEAAILHVKGFRAMTAVSETETQHISIAGAALPAPLLHNPVRAEKDATPEAIDKLTSAQHLDIIRKQGHITAEKYGKYDTKSKRIKSWLGEKIGTLFGAQAGALTGGFLAWCAGALALPVTIGGAVLGAYLINKYMQKKGLDPTSRMRVAAIQKLARRAENEPYTYASILKDPKAVESFITRDILYRKLGSAAVTAGLAGVASASMLHYRTDGAIWNEIGKSIQTGDWNNVWALFYCNPNGRGAHALAEAKSGGIVAGDIQNGRYVAGDIQAHGPRTPRLTYQNHMSCIGRCQSPYGVHEFANSFGPRGSHRVPSMVRTFGGGRWNG